MKEKKNKIIIVIISILLVLSILIIGFIIINNTNHKTNNKTNKETEKVQKEPSNIESNDYIIDNNITIDNFDFEEMKKTLHEAVNQDNLTTMVRHCKNIEVPQGEPPEAEYNNVEVSNNSIDIIIEKLKTANSVQYMTGSWFGCPPKQISYYVAPLTDDDELFNSKKVLSIHYSNDEKTLSVGYKNDGYIFIFNSPDEINGFIESLK